jgi:hypothetical protein
MGRNPVVGRQGPEYHAAELPTKTVKAGLRVKQIRSGIGRPASMRRVLTALGFGTTRRKSW